MVGAVRSEHDSEWAVIATVAELIGVGAKDGA